MNSLRPQQLVDQLRWRYATKKFDPARKLSAEVWSALEEGLVLTPSSFGLQPWRFVVITDSAVKQRLVAASWGQTQPADCSHHVVFASRRGLTEADVDRYFHRTMEVRGGSLEAQAGYRRVILGSLQKATEQGWADDWCQWQAYIALGSLMTSAAMLGVDTCPMEGIDTAKYDEILGLPERGFVTRVACAAGYRAPGDRHATLAKVRYPASEVVIRI